MAETLGEFSYADLLQAVNRAPGFTGVLETGFSFFIEKLSTHAVMPNPAATARTGEFAEHYTYWIDSSVRCSSFSRLCRAVSGSPVPEAVPHMENPTREGLPPLPKWEMPKKQTKFQILCSFIYSKTVGRFW